MNKVILIGNITKDIELKTTAGGTSVATFTVACQRNYKNAEGRYETDFINCVAWKNTADFLSKYFGKGSSIAVTGRMQTRSYEAQDGGKRYVTEVIVEETEFVGKKEKTEYNVSANDLFGTEADDFKPFEDGDMPF